MREPRDNNAHATGTEDDNDSPAVGLLRLNVLPERLVEEPPHVSYGDESVCNAFRSRVGWLGLFLVGLWSAAFIIDAFEHTLQANVELAHFVPLIIGQGGNAGSQAVSSVIRGLAGKEIDVHSKPTGWVVAKESAVGALCGLVLGTFVLVVGYVCHPNPNPNPNPNPSPNLSPNPNPRSSPRAPPPPRPCRLRPTPRVARRPPRPCPCQRARRCAAGAKPRRRACASARPTPPRCAA